MMPASRPLQEIHESNRGERRRGYLCIHRSFSGRMGNCVGYASCSVLLRCRFVFLLFHESELVVNVVIVFDYTHLDRSELGSTFEHIRGKIIEKLIVTHTSRIGEHLGMRSQGGGSVQGVVLRRLGWQRYRNHGHRFNAQ